MTDTERIIQSVAREIQDRAATFREDTPLTAALVALYEAHKAGDDGCCSTCIYQTNGKEACPSCLVLPAFCMVENILRERGIHD